VQGNLDALGKGKSESGCWPLVLLACLICNSIPEGRVDRLPVAEDVSIPVQANLIIELCSK
jgi:hypothetical protein